jgi:hypothetical protein
MAFTLPLMVVIGLVTMLAVAGYWLMKPTVLKNPGLAVYKPPAAAKVLDYGWGDRLPDVELAANEAAHEANQKLGIEPSLLARAQSTDGADERSPVAAAPKQKVKTVRAHKRQDAPGQSPQRAAQRQGPAQPAFAQWPFRMWAN